MRLVILLLPRTTVEWTNIQIIAIWYPPLLRYKIGNGWWVETFGPSCEHKNLLFEFSLWKEFSAFGLPLKNFTQNPAVSGMVEAPGCAQNSLSEPSFVEETRREIGEGRASAAVQVGLRPVGSCRSLCSDNWVTPVLREGPVERQL